MRIYIELRTCGCLDGIPIRTDKRRHHDVVEIQTTNEAEQQIKCNNINVNTLRIIDKKTAGHHCQTVFTLFLIIKQLQTASFIYSFSCMQFERIMSFFSILQRYE